MTRDSVGIVNIGTVEVVELGLGFGLVHKGDGQIAVVFLIGNGRMKSSSFLDETQRESEWTRCLTEFIPILRREALIPYIARLVMNRLRI